MARPKRIEAGNAAPEGEQADIAEVITTDTPELATVIVEPVAHSDVERASRVWVEMTDLNVMTSEGRFFEKWRAYLPEEEANTLVAEGRAKLCP